MHRYLRYSLLGLRLLLPRAAERRQLRLIRDSGLFDRDWYRQSNPRLPFLCRWLPERHYLLRGEKAGLCPAPGFSPRAYLHLNPDLPPDTPALLHYIRSGRAEGRAARDLPAGAEAPLLPEIRADAGPAHPARLAVVLHLYYRDIWEEIAARLQHSGLEAAGSGAGSGAAECSFDLFVTLTEDPTRPEADIRARILADFPAARIFSFPNHGRDILPFLHLLRARLLRPYAAICKIHSKKSPHRSDGAHWREQLISGLLNPDTPARLADFLSRDAAGIWVADGHRFEGQAWWGPNRDRATALIARAGLPPAGDRLCFAAGSMFWLRPPLPALLAALPFTAADFEPEMGQVDGTTAHVLERLFGMVAAEAGLRIFESRELGGAARPPITGAITGAATGSGPMIETKL